MSENAKGCTPKSATGEDVATTSHVADEVFDPITNDIFNAYGPKKLMRSVGLMMRMKAPKQKIMKVHMNSVARDPEVKAVLEAHKGGIGKVLKAVFAVILHVSYTQRRDDLLLDTAEESSNLLDNKILAKQVKPGKVGSLVAGRPEFCSKADGGIDLPKERWDYMMYQSSLGLVITPAVLWMLAKIHRLPEGYLQDREVIDDAVHAGAAEEPVEPISHRHHLNQVYQLVKTALRQGVTKLHSLIKMDGTGRFHDYSRTGHQGPGGVRCLHSAPTKKAVNIDDMALWAWHLLDAHGIHYKDIQSYLENDMLRLVLEGKSLNAGMSMHKFLQASRTGKTDFLFEGDMNLSLAIIKGLFTGCVSSLTMLGMLGGKRVNTWQVIAALSAKSCKTFSAVAKNMWRKLTKGAGTPLGYDAHPNTAGVAILGLTGVRINGQVISRLDDLLIPTFDSNGKERPREFWDVVPLEAIEPLCKPDIVKSFRERALIDYPTYTFSTGMLVDYAEEMAEAIQSAMHTTLPCLDIFSKMVVPPAKRASKRGDDRTILGPYGYRSIIPGYKLSKDNKDTIRVSVRYKDRRRKVKYIKAYVNDSNLAVGPYAVFILESASLVRLWLRTCFKVGYQKAIHDALLVAIQDARYMNAQHNQALVDVVEMMDLDQFDLVDKKGNLLVDVAKRAEVLERVRKEGNPWGLPSEKECRADFPDLLADLNKVNPTKWQIAVPREKSIVLFNDTAA